MTSYCPWDKIQTPFVSPLGWHDLLHLPFCNSTPHSSPSSNCFPSTSGAFRQVYAHLGTFPPTPSWLAGFYSLGIKLSVNFSEMTFLLPSIPITFSELLTALAIIWNPVLVYWLRCVWCAPPHLNSKFHGVLSVLFQLYTQLLAHCWAQCRRQRNV